MYRLNISEKKRPSGQLCYRVRHKPTGIEATVSISGHFLASAKKKDIVDDVKLYQLLKVSKELVREIIYSKYGKNWRLQEEKHKKQIDKSIKRAIKFSGAFKESHA